MTESWKAVDGFDGFYEVSDRGRVRSCARVIACKNGKPAKNLREKIMSGGVKDNGYVLLSLRKPGEKQVKRLLHRMVAAAFIPRTPGRDEVNHLDGDKLNNAVENLAWCTRAENMAHAWDNGFFVYQRRAG